MKRGVSGHPPLSVEVTAKVGRTRNGQVGVRVITVFIRGKEDVNVVLSIGNVRESKGGTRVAVVQIAHSQFGLIAAGTVAVVIDVLGRPFDGGGCRRASVVDECVNRSDFASGFRARVAVNGAIPVGTVDVRRSNECSAGKVLISVIFDKVHSDTRKISSYVYFSNQTL